MHVIKRGGPSLNGAWQMMLDAADRIDQLENSLRYIRDNITPDDFSANEACHLEARWALEVDIVSIKETVFPNIDKITTVYEEQPDIRNVVGDNEK
jgi:hypothetical protein